MHIALLQYPADGVDVNLVVFPEPFPPMTQAITIPAGTAPYIFNVSCMECYTPSAQVSAYLTYPDMPDQRMSLAQDGIAITHLTVADGDDAMSSATVVASFSGLTQGDAYSLDLWCNDPPMVRTHYILANSAPSVTYNSLPGTCYSTRYLIITSANGVDKAVANP